MATSRMIDLCMNMFVATWSKKPEWKDTLFPVWEHSLKTVKDKHLYDATMRVVSKTWQYPPVIGELLKEIEVVIKELGGTGITLKEFEFCEQCIQREGVVEVSAHFLVHETGKTKVHNTITRCTCHGASQKYTQMKSCEDLYQRMQHDARITVKAWYQTSGATPYLPMQQREPVQYAKLQAWLQTPEAQQADNPYMKFVHNAQRGQIHVPPEHKLSPVRSHYEVDNRTTTDYTYETDIDPDDCIY